MMSTKRGSSPGSAGGPCSANSLGPEWAPPVLDDERFSRNGIILRLTTSFNRTRLLMAECSGVLPPDGVGAAVED